MDFSIFGVSAEVVVLFLWALELLLTVAVVLDLVLVVELESIVKTKY